MEAQLDPLQQQTPVLRPGIGPVLDPFEDVRRIAVLRGGGLGDLLFAMPAIDALAAAYPEAEITLLGTPLHAQLLSGRPGPVAAVEVLPIAEGVRPGPGEDPAEVDLFLSRMRQQRFDLAVQVHGGGRYSNPFLLQLGARHTVGTRTDDAAALERSLPYVYYQNEVLRALEVAGLTGAAPVSMEPQLRTTSAERAAAVEHADGRRPVIALHPGATDPRRRWPAAHFAQLAAWAADDGAEVLVVGDGADKAVAETIVEEARAASAAGSWIRSLAGGLALGELAAVLERAELLVGNDSGPRHLAQAVGTPTIGIYWIGNVINAGALGRALHRVHMSWLTRCPVCEIDVTQVGWTADRCEHQDSFVAPVTPQSVYADVRSLRATSPLLRGR